MKLLVADYLYLDGSFVEGYGVAFEETIYDIDDITTLIARYPEAETIRCAPYSVVYPGFVNAHVHLEFSANKTTLQYGDFIPWLYSVIANRDELKEQCNDSVMEAACDEMLRCGITAFGAISSFGIDLEVCRAVPQRVVYFNELIGSAAAYADALYADFLHRLEASKEDAERYRLTPAVAIHSPYAVHPVLLQRAVTLAREEGLPLSTHFLESPDEREWLEKAEGRFREFFETFFNTGTPVTDIETFVNAFSHYPTLFVHAVQANDTELSRLKNDGHTIAHCPRSNRYLGCGRLRVEKLMDMEVPYCVATDGLSSNDSLNLFEEMKAALMLHHQAPLTHFADKLIRSVTVDAAQALKLPCGRIAKGKAADFCIVTLPELPARKEEIALHTILHVREASAVYIAGERYFGHV